MQSSSESGRPGGIGGLASKASTGAVWTIAGHGGEQIVRLASNLIVTRLLLAEYFGLMALVSVFLIGLQLFSDIGIGPALVQNKREDPGFVNTVWTIQVFRGLALCAIAFPLAPLFAEFYGEPILTALDSSVGPHGSDSRIHLHVVPHANAASPLEGPCRRSVCVPALRHDCHGGLGLDYAQRLVARHVRYRCGARHGGAQPCLAPRNPQSIPLRATSGPLPLRFR